MLDTNILLIKKSKYYENNNLHNYMPSNEQLNMGADERYG